MDPINNPSNHPNLDNIDQPAQPTGDMDGVPVRVEDNVRDRLGSNASIVSSIESDLSDRSIETLDDDAVEPQFEVAPEAQEAGADIPQEIRDLDDQALIQRGEDQLKVAKDTFKKHHDFDIGYQAQSALKQLFDIADPWSNIVNPFTDDKSARFDALKAFQLPENAPEELSVTIKYPGEEAISLIPPGEALRNMKPYRIKELYKAAHAAMSVWQQQNFSTPQSRTQAQERKNEAFTLLQQIRTEIDNRRLQYAVPVGHPVGSQLEMRFDEYQQQSFTVNCSVKPEYMRQEFERQVQQAQYLEAERADDQAAEQRREGDRADIAEDNIP